MYIKREIGPLEILYYCAHECSTITPIFPLPEHLPVVLGTYHVPNYMYIQN
jgi:hypothetical protein